MNVPLIDCHTHIGADLHFYREGYFPYALDYRALIQQAKPHGVTRFMTFPFVSYIGWEGQTLQSNVSTEELSTPYAFENRRMLEEIFQLHSDISEASLPLVIVDPARKQKEQVAALRKLKERFPIRGIKIQATIIQAPIRELLGAGSCLVDLAAEWNVPMLIHSSFAPDDIWSQSSDILDVAQARPDVRFCLAHSCRFDLPSLQRLGTLANTWFDCSAHCIHCDAAVDNLKVVATPDKRLKADYTRPDNVMKVLYDLLPDRMMWGSDAPFYSYSATHDGKTISLISSYDREIAALGLLSNADKKAIMHDNILHFLGLKSL